MSGWGNHEVPGASRTETILLLVAIAVALVLGLVGTGAHRFAA